MPGVLNKNTATIQHAPIQTNHLHTTLFIRLILDYISI